MARKKSISVTAPLGTTRYKLQQRAKKLRPAVLKVRAKIPWVFGDNTYVYVAIAANGGVLRETDITASLGEAATRSLRQPDRDALGIIRRYQIRTAQGTGPRGYAAMFDETFPLAKEVKALALKIGKLHPFPIDNKMPKETPPPPLPRKFNLDLLAGNDVNTAVLATARVLGGKVRPGQFAAAVPHGSITAVTGAVQRLRDYDILHTDQNGFVNFKDAPWLPELKALYAAYLRLRAAIAEEIRTRLKAKNERLETWYAQNLLGHDVEERASDPGRPRPYVTERTRVIGHDDSERPDSQQTHHGGDTSHSRRGRQRGQRQKGPRHA